MKLQQVTITLRTTSRNDFGEEVPSDTATVQAKGIVTAPTVTESGETLAPDGTECDAVLYLTKGSLPDSLRADGALRHAKVLADNRVFDVVGNPYLAEPPLSPTEFVPRPIPLRRTGGE